MDFSEGVYSQRERALQLGDHESYRKQLSRQLASTRKRLGRSTKKGSKFTPKDPITADDISKSHEYINLLTLPAERAWAHAFSLKTAHEDDNAGKGIYGSTRSHIASRLHKAAKYAEQIVDLAANSASGASENDWLQAKAYAFSLSGAEEFEKHATTARSEDVDIQRAKLEDCLRKFSAARVIYSALMKSSGRKDIYKEVISGTIDPSLRYAAYQAHIPRTVAVVTIAKKFFPRDDARLVKAVTQLDQSALSEDDAGRSSDSGIPTTVTWRSRKANIVDASIGQAMAAVSIEQARLESFLASSKPDSTLQERAAAFDGVLTASQDATDATRHAIEDHEKEGISEGDSRMQDLRVTNLAVNYDLIGWRVGRNRVLIGKDDGVDLETSMNSSSQGESRGGRTEKPKSVGLGRRLLRLRERVVLYDAILQSIDSVMELPGAAEAKFRGEMEGKRSYFQALKCLNIAYSHALTSDAKKCLALLLRAKSLASTASSKQYSPSSNPTEVPKLELSPAAIETVQQTIANLTHYYQGLVELQMVHNNSVNAAGKQSSWASPAVEKLDEYPAAGVDLKNLVTYPPKLKPIPMKPLFYDLAWNYIDYPGRLPEANSLAPKKEAAEAKETAKEQKKGGWGWFGR